MELHGVPNDSIQALNAIACVILGPIIQQVLYPFLNRRKIHFRPIARIAVGFIVIGAGMAYAAGVQQLIYNSGPCYDAPLKCAASDGGRVPNRVNVWVQTPTYFILAVAEIFGFVSASEYAYSKAPENMKAVVQALTQLTAGVGSAIGIAIAPVAKDPYLMIMYAALAGVMVPVTAAFWFMFKKYDKIDEELNSLISTTEKAQEPETV